VDERRSCAAGLSGTLDLQIAHLEGVDSEMELGVAALHQLTRPSLGHIDMLPEPQSDALGRTLGLPLAAPESVLAGR
jgi:hypothetical protein